jgi:indole-3-glycerol phosphate synthase
MVERRRELNARYTKKRKMNKLKAKLKAPGADRATLIAKIKKMSPWWTEASLEQGSTSAATTGAASDAAAAASAKKKPTGGGGEQRSPAKKKPQ